MNPIEAAWRVLKGHDPPLPPTYYGTIDELLYNQSAGGHNPKKPTEKDADAVIDALDFHKPEVVSANTQRGLPRGAPLGYESMEHYYAVQQGKPWPPKPVEEE